MAATGRVWGWLVAAGAVAAAGALIGAAGPGDRDAERSEGPASITMTSEVPVDLAGLENIVAYAPGYYSGSMPHARDGGFESLARLGIKTIISVDGAAPDVARARALGMRTIHLPIGYDGIDATRRLELARASRDARLDGPVYVHCHHGKHRSAGAAGMVAVSLGWSTPEAMLARMKISGTSPHYTGLYAVTADATRMSAAALDAIDGDFPSVALTSGMIQGMVQIDHAFDHLEQIADAGWKVPEHHPDLVPAAEAGTLSDVLRLLIDDDETGSEPPEFQAMMRASHDAAQRLEEMIIANESPAALGAQFDLVAASCKDCHTPYRD